MVHARKVGHVPDELKTPQQSASRPSVSQRGRRAARAHLTGEIYQPSCPMNGKSNEMPWQTDTSGKRYWQEEKGAGSRHPSFAGVGTSLIRYGRLLYRF
jgi:hypothetical protein